ncbi:MAG: hypothetical protein ACJAXN_002221 [Psychromonas sp.]|jgi:hypothetical protein
MPKIQYRKDSAGICCRGIFLPYSKPQELTMAVNNSKTSCPFCNGVNKCMAESESPCWCFEVQIPKSLMALMPAGFTNKSCICQACINAFKEN